MNAESAALELARTDPGFAVALGELDGAHVLPPGRASFPLERVATLSALAEQATAALEQNNPAARLDVEHFTHCAALERFTEIELGLRMKNPDVLSRLNDHALGVWFAPFSTDAARARTLRALLGEVPFQLAEAATTLHEPDALWRHMAHEAAAGTLALVEAIATRYPSARAEAALAVSAVKTFERALREVRAVERARLIDRDGLQKLFALRGIPLDLYELEALGREQVARLRERCAGFAKALTGYPDVKNASRALERDAPGSLEETLREARAFAREAHDFCGERGIVPIPSDEQLQVTETVFPGATVVSPRPRWPLQLSVLGCSQPLPPASLRNLIAHQGYPGRHLYAAFSHREGSLWRNAPWTPTMGLDALDGWAHYAEALMQGQGLHPAPEDRFAACRASLSRALGLLLDIEVVTGAVTLEDAAQRLVDELALPPAAALAEVKRISLGHAHHLSCLVGKHLIRELRHEAERVWQRGFSAARFHALIMSNGRASLALARRRLLLDSPK